jgi:hypothetical protein
MIPGHLKAEDNFLGQLQLHPNAPDETAAPAAQDTHGVVQQPVESPEWVSISQQASSCCTDISRGYDP